MYADRSTQSIDLLYTYYMRICICMFYMRKPHGCAAAFPRTRARSAVRGLYASRPSFRVLSLVSILRIGSAVAPWKSPHGPFPFDASPESSCSPPVPPQLFRLRNWCTPLGAGLVHLCLEFGADEIRLKTLKSLWANARQQLLKTLKRRRDSRQLQLGLVRGDRT